MSSKQQSVPSVLGFMKVGNADQNFCKEWVVRGPTVDRWTTAASLLQ